MRISSRKIEGRKRNRTQIDVVVNLIDEMYATKKQTNKREGETEAKQTIVSLDFFGVLWEGGERKKGKRKKGRTTILHSLPLLFSLADASRGTCAAFADCGPRFAFFFFSHFLIVRFHRACACKHSPSFLSSLLWLLVNCAPFPLALVVRRSLFGNPSIS